MNQGEINALWDFDDPAESERRFVTAISQTDRSDVDRAELQTQLARALGLQGRFTEARKLLAATPLIRPLVEIRAALELGRPENSSGAPDAAGPHFEAAAALSLQIGNDLLAVDALHMLAIVDPAQSPEWSRQALEIVERSNDPAVKRWAIGLHNNLGWHWHDLGEFETALAEFKLASTAAMAYGSATQRFIARWAIARALRSLGRNDEALAIQRELAAEDATDAYVQQEIAELTK